MTDLATIAPAFVDMAHSIVWCTGATTDPAGRPRSRVLHPIWQWDGQKLTGWIATDPNSPKRAHLDASPYLSCTYWAPNQDTCTADCKATVELDIESRRATWDRFANTPEPVGYDPTLIPQWDSPEAEAFGSLRLEPWSLRVLPGSMVTAGTGELLTWRA